METSYCKLGEYVDHFQLTGAKLIKIEVVSIKDNHDGLLVHQIGFFRGEHNGIVGIYSFHNTETIPKRYKHHVNSYFFGYKSIKYMGSELWKAMRDINE